MQFRDFAENLLGSKVKIKVLRKLLTEAFLPSERELAKLIGVSYTAVSRALKDFHELNLISPLRIGNAMTWRLNEKSYACEFLSNVIGSMQTSPLEHLKETLHEHLKDMREKGKIKLIKAVIFGSVAEGREMPDSDIDLFILVQSEEERNHLLNSAFPVVGLIIQEMYGNKLSPQIFTMKDYADPKNKKFLENVEKGITVLS
ncbi:MAG: nucleotidyltransferase domain-containing protein [Candidatus Aenigmatarchaeota archaeon]